MKPQGKHARPKKRRGNQYTAPIHIVASVIAYFFGLGTIRHFDAKGEFLGNAHAPVIFVMAAVFFVLWEVALAIVFAFGTMFYVERKKTRSARLLKRL